MKRTIHETIILCHKDGTNSRTLRSLVRFLACFVLSDTAIDSEGAIAHPAIKWEGDTSTTKFFSKGHLVTEVLTDCGYDGGNCALKFPAAAASSAKELASKFELDMQEWSSSQPGGYFQLPPEILRTAEGWEYRKTWGYDC